MTVSMVHPLRTISSRCAQLPRILPNIRTLYLAPPFLVGDYEPRAARTAREGGMEEKVRLAVRELESCVACPRLCKVNR